MSRSRRRMRMGTACLLGLVLWTSACADSEPVASPSLTYVALGDSYTAAPGVPSPAPDQSCLRSTRNYPALFASRHGDVELHDRSCSGATTSDLTLPQAVGTTVVAPQLADLPAGTDLVTLSLGANDNELFRDMVVTCSQVRVFDPVGAPCQNSPGREGQQATTSTLTLMGQSLAAGIARLREVAPGARIIVVGYPQILAPGPGCPDRLSLAAGDVAYVSGLNQALNATLQRVAEETGSEFLDVWSLTVGHDVCAADPWIAGAQGAADASGLHPRPPEQAAVAEALLRLVRDSG